MKKFLFFIILSTFSIFLFAKNIDSLKNVLKNSSPKDKPQIYLQLIESTKSDSLQLLINYAQQAQQIAQQEFQDTLYAKFLNKIALQFYFKGFYSLAEKYFQLSLNQEIKNQNTLNVAKMYSNIAVTHEQRSNYKQAVENYHKALDEFEKAGYKAGIAKIYNNLGVLYQEMGMKQQAINYYRKAIDIKKQLKNYASLASTYNNLGVVYEELVHNNDSALFYYNKALAVYDSLKSLNYYATTLQNISVILLESGEYKLALQNFFKIEKIFKTNGNEQGLAWTYRNIAQAYMYATNYDSAENYLNKSIQISKELNDKHTLLENYKILSQLYYNTKKYQQSALIYQKYIDLYDSVKSIENQRQIDELNKKYETSLLENRISVLDEENQIKNKKIQQNRLLDYFFVILLLMVIGVGLLLRKIFIYKNKEKQADLEQKVLRLQMNPHFMSNALVSAQNFILENKTLEAFDYLSDLSSIMRQTIKATRVNLISIDEELDLCTKYLKIQQKRYGNLFDYEIVLPSDFDTSLYKIPPMLIQPFLENSIKHGFKNIDYKGSIILNLKKQNDYLIITIEDNGLGMQTNYKSHTSYTIKITQQRLKIISKQTKKMAKLELKNKEKGFVVSIIIPLML